MDDKHARAVFDALGIENGSSRGSELQSQRSMHRPGDYNLPVYFISPSGIIVFSQLAIKSGSAA
jgi:hypothetical protein